MERITKFPLINLEGYTHALIDIDDTLYSYKNLCEQALDFSVQFYSKKSKFSEDELKQAYLEGRKIRKNLKPNEASLRSRLYYWMSGFEEAHSGSFIQESLELENIYWNYFYEHMQSFEGVDEFFKNCKKHSITTIIVTDMCGAAQIKKLKALKLIDKIDYFLCSEEIGEEKPGDEFVKNILRKTNNKDAKFFVIGDNLEKDGILAKKIGADFYRV